MSRRKLQKKAAQMALQAAEGPVRAGVYLRVSTDDQANTGYGLDVQRERCLALAVAKGWTVAEDHIWADEGISGTKDESGRPGLAAIMAAAESRIIDAIIILELNRLGRRSTIILGIADRLEIAGVNLASCKESIDTSTPTGRFMLTMLAGLAQLDRDSIVGRTTDGRNVRGRIDGEKGGRLRYGYIRTEHGIEIDPTAAANIRRIFADRRVGLSQRAIAQNMNMLGPSPQGGRWHASTIKDILLGEDEYRGGNRGDSQIHWPRILT